MAKGQFSAPMKGKRKGGVTASSANNTDNALVGKSASILDSMQDVSSFAARVLGPDTLFIVVVHVCEVDRRRRGTIGGAGGNPDHTHGVLGCDLSCSGEDGVDEVGEEERGEIVHANLQLVALHGLGPLRRDHDTSVVIQDV